LIHRFESGRRLHIVTLAPPSRGLIRDAGDFPGVLPIPLMLRAMTIEPWRRFEACLERVVAGPRPLARLLLVALCTAAAWWIYVPLHELAHAGGCVSCGGEVRRMTLAPLYGGTLAARRFHWIDDRTPYAGQLADFSTGGSDLCYLWLVLAPFVATPLARPLLCRAERRGSAPAFAAGVILAAAPVLSIPGDFYEASSIVVTRAAGCLLPNASRLRSDDLAGLVSRLAAGGATHLEWAAVIGAATLGLLAALALTAACVPSVASAEAGPRKRGGAEVL
jgi:hypothetical protein